MSRPYLWGALVGGLAGVLILRARGGRGLIPLLPKTPKPLRSEGRLDLPGEQRRIGA